MLKLVHTKAESPIGQLDIVASERGIVIALFEDSEQTTKEISRLIKKLKAELIIGENRHTLEFKKQLREYFSGARQRFSVPLQLIGTAFQNEVWTITRAIPYGKQVSYKAQTLKFRDIKSVRAVGRANGLNKIMIAIPCHRVVASDGKLSGYAGGIDRKRFLLNLERQTLGERDLFSE
ncbi:MAG: methylated-DNA--[protein]-cysteine S-methyltransferase [Crocinitomicaceae bacterium]|nr:methylated-DNA--[protein]-cysteine S-methyltransferase [Crocinitomicaceae bacterium]